MTLLAATLGGSILSTSCSTRLKEAVVSGSKDFLFALMDPDVILEWLSPETSE
jgi:hypothetical protein